ncbi:Stomatal closure-related actin-binding protein 1 [Glycine max]|nr:Stomatal closure-related actin-binding protein 1 [Glycine max]
MTRMTHDFGDTMQKDAVPVVSADVIFASLRFPNYKIGVNNQIMETKDDPKVLSMKEVVARETAQLLDQQKRMSVRDLASKFEKGLAAAAKLSEEARLREAASLEKHVLLKKLRDALQSLKGRVAGRNKDDVAEAIAMVEALAVQLTQREGELIQEKSEVKKLTNFLKQASEDAKKLVNEERAFARFEIENARAAVQRVEEALQEHERMSQASGKQDLEQLMKEVQEARRIKMLHQPSKVMDMEHELRALRAQLAEKSRLYLRLQKELARTKKGEENAPHLYELEGTETLGSYLQIQPCSDNGPELSECSIQWYRVSSEGAKKELISGRRRSVNADSNNTIEDDGQRHTCDNLQEGQWTQVKSRRKATSKTFPVLGRGIDELKAPYQVTARGKQPSSTWRDRPDITSFYFSPIPPMSRAEVSLRGCHVPLAAPEGLTPGGVGQKDCNGPLASDMHGEGMADTRTFYPSKQHNPFLEVGVDDKVQDALIKSNNLWVQGDEPSVISPKASLGVKHGSNPICPYERISAGLVEGVSDHNLGLVTTSPSSKGTQSLSAFKVYVRRKGSVAANHMAHVNLNPEPAGRTPKQDCPSQSPVTNSSFNNSYFENEEDLHREIARDLDMEVEEVRSVGRYFTWCRPNGTVMSKLDRFLLSDDWLSQWLDTTQFVLDRDFSDHCPILLRSRTNDWGPKPFKIMDWWLKDKSFQNMVAHNWGNYHPSGWGGFALKQKLKFIKDRIRVLKSILRIFEMASGLKINYAKSQFGCMGKSEAWCREAALFLNCGQLEFPFSYLGIPVGNRVDFSPWWKDLRAVFQQQHSNSLINNMRWKVGDGVRIRFWKDKWKEGELTLQDKYPALYQVSTQQNHSINSMGLLVDNRWEWKFQWRRNLFDHEIGTAAAFMADIEDVHIQPSSRDFLLWSADSGGSYTTKSAYNLLKAEDRHVTEDSASKIIWSLKMPPRARATKSVYAPEPFDVGRVLQVDIISEGQQITLSTTGPIDPAAGLGTYVEALVRKHDTEFNVVVTQTVSDHPNESIHVLHVGKMRMKLCKGNTTIAKEYYSSSMQLCGVRGGGNAAAQAVFWQPKQGLSFVLAFESERERNAAIMLARRFAFDCNIILAGPDHKAPLET